MKVKRVFASISGQFDDWIRRVENHQAVAESAIEDARRHAAKIHSEVAHCLARLGQLNARSKELEKRIERWRDRAASVASEDREKALRCLHAAKSDERELLVLRSQEAELDALCADMQRHLQQAEQQVTELQNRKADLSARSARNRVVSINRSGGEALELDSVFQRWEESVMSDEYVVSARINPDTELDVEFQKQEDRLALEKDLSQLLAERGEQNV